MSFSVIIPTYNRAKDLRETLDSILKQVKLPKEVIIVDNGNSIETINVIRKQEINFKNKDINLKYIKNRENSLTVARNIGVAQATEELVSFLDDDIILEEVYYEEILKVYKENNNALGVQGLVHVEGAKSGKGFFSLLAHLLTKLFYLESVEEDKCKLFPTTFGTYPLFLDKDKIINCEWLTGPSTYRKKVFEEFSFDENLKKYSHKEDKDFSYRVFKKYPKSLFIAPKAGYIHKVSQESRLSEKDLITMISIYGMYIFYKDVDQTIKNKLIFIWGWTGSLLLNTFILVGSYLLKGSKSKLLTIKYTFGAYLITARHLKEIKDGDLSFFNTELMNE